jgi:integrase/recombinase XerD
VRQYFLKARLMKKLILKTEQYEYLEKGFKEWMDILGFSESNVYNTPHILREFLHFLENNNISAIQALEHKHIDAYYGHITKRANQRRDGGLSSTHINKHLQAIEKFLEYLHHRGIQSLPSMNIKLEKIYRDKLTVVTTDEIKLLFTATGKDAIATTHHHYTRFNEAMQARDRAMLAVYYSCGLRRNEGVHLSIDDINFDTQILHVKKGKNYKERYVPFNKTNAQYLQLYVYDHRPLFAKDRKEDRLFMSVGGRQFNGGSLLLRLQRLQQLTEDAALQQKAIGLHTLRHSIATHLLAAGMSLEKIAQFLGHSSLDSTQIYTHLIEKQHEQL